MEEGPVLLRVSFRGASTTIGTTPDVELDELERVLAALFLSPQERAAGIKPVGFALPQDCFVSLRTACSDLPLVSALDDSVKLLVSFPSGDDSSDEGQKACDASDAASTRNAHAPVA